MTDTKRRGTNDGASQKQDNTRQPNSREQRGGYQPPTGTGDNPTNPPGKK